MATIQRDDAEGAEVGADAPGGELLGADEAGAVVAGAVVAGPLAGLTWAKQNVAKSNVEPTANGAFHMAELHKRERRGDVPNWQVPAAFRGFEQ